MPSRHPSRRTRGAALLLAGLLLSGGCTDDGATGDETLRLAAGTGVFIQPDRRDVAPVLRDVTLTGETLDTGLLRGGLLVLNIWGSWCNPCIKEQPELERAAKDASALGARFVGLNVRDTRESALAHVRRFDVSYPSLYDRTQKLQAKFRRIPTQAIPTTIVIDREGRVASYLLGATTYEEIMGIIRRVAEVPE